jgi:hypothetical protein
MPAPQYENSVFVNCPFDDAYHGLFEALVFAIHDCGYIAHCALEIDDGSEARIEKIIRIISACRLGIHDISRTEFDSTCRSSSGCSSVPSGLDALSRKQKNCLILDVERYRYQKFISDIAGQDIAAHRGDVIQAIRIVRDWLSNAARNTRRIPGGTTVAARFHRFRAELPELCSELKVQPEELTFNDYVLQVEQWLKLNARIPT